jgi:hypothetical protein
MLHLNNIIPPINLSKLAYRHTLLVYSITNLKFLYSRLL